MTIQSITNFILGATRQSSAKPVLNRRHVGLLAMGGMLTTCIIGVTEISAQAESFTYSYSNLLDDELDLAGGLSRYDVIRAVEEALAVWASAAPLNFVEVTDAGPSVSDSDYVSLGTPDFRLGHHDFAGKPLAHAYFPGSSGLASDVHLDSSDRTWTEPLLTTALVHELGHALGVEHINDQRSIMNPVLDANNTLPGIDAAFLFAADELAVQAIWKRGSGSVTSPRHWAGAVSPVWSADQNWREGWRPTRRSEVHIDRDGSLTVGDSQNVQSLIMGGGTNSLRVSSRATLMLGGDAILGRAEGGTAFVANGVTARLQVPTDDKDQANWTDTAFDDTAWDRGETPIGYERSVGFESLIATDLEAPMFNRNGSFYARVQFDVTDPEQLDFLQLRMRYDDGFVAYLNGVRLAAANAPTLPNWRSTAVRSRGDDAAFQVETFDLAGWQTAIRPGKNVLAIQGLNSRISSSDLLMAPELTGARIDNRIVIDGGELRVGGDLRLAESAGSQSTIQVTDGRLIISGNVTTGSGQGRIVMQGGVLRVDGGRPAHALVSAGQAARIVIPTDANLGGSWRELEFDDDPWTSGPTGIGFEQRVGLNGLIATDISDRMFSQSATAYVRIPFDWQPKGEAKRLELRMKFDDGFVAYLNGTEIGRANAPNLPTWNSTATRSTDDATARRLVEFDVTPFASLLVPGTNVLAIQGLNSTDTSSEFLILPELIERPIGGTLSVSQLDFTGGEIQGMTRFEGVFQHRQGRFSPQHPVDGVDGPGQLAIDGAYLMDPAATLELDAFGDQPTMAETLDVTGLTRLDGTLAITFRSTTLADSGLARGDTQAWTLVRSSQIESRFASVLVDGERLTGSHQGDGLFRRLAYAPDEVALVSYWALPGDTNGDKVFNSSDLVEVFQAGQYEDGVAGNSDWTSGDWTGDSEFDSEDLIAALQSARYSAAARSVPEPTGRTLWVIGALVGFRPCRRRPRAACRSRRIRRNW